MYKTSVGRLQQRGYLAILGLVLALAIVGFLARDTLKTYLPGARATASDASSRTKSGAIATPPLERAKEVQEALKSHAEGRGEDARNTENAPAGEPGKP
jgi:hypothetical protein